MTKINCILATKNNYWSQVVEGGIVGKLRDLASWRVVHDKKGLSAALLKGTPDWVFFFHWSEIVHKDIFENYKCVVMHTSPGLPDGRGGSPIQNQILDQIVTSRVHALKMVEKLDAGPVYCSREMSLQGTIDDIWQTIAKVSVDVIEYCIRNNPNPIPQESREFVKYKRRSDNHIDFNGLDSLDRIYDFIRMIDSDEYGHARLDVGKYGLSFSRAKFDGKKILCDVEIREKDVKP